ncbi:MAG: hypothetical protein QM758_08190 [Armatimonas sp.]
MRYAFPLLLLTTAVMLSGCGGGGGNNSLTQLVSTGGTGRLENVQFGPKGGTAFISRSQTFQMAWTTAAPPPQIVQVSLMRYQEARGGEARTITSQRVRAQPAAGSLTWDIIPTSSMAADGVYFLELATNNQTTQRACYLVDSTRAAAQTRGVTINTGTGSGQLSNVQISPTTGSVYLPRASTFQITCQTPPHRHPALRFACGATKRRVVVRTAPWRSRLWLIPPAQARAIPGPFAAVMVSSWMRAECTT